MKRKPNAQRSNWSWPSSVDIYSLGEEEEEKSTMPKSRPPYPAAFRQQMVELVRFGRKRGELAWEFEPSAEAICKWVAQADRDAGRRTDGLRTEEQEEIRRLRRENRRLRKDCGRDATMRGLAPNATSLCGRWADAELRWFSPASWEAP